MYPMPGWVAKPPCTDAVFVFITGFIIVTDGCRAPGRPARSPYANEIGEVHSCLAGRSVARSLPGRSSESTEEKQGETGRASHPKSAISPYTDLWPTI